VGASAPPALRRSALVVTRLLLGFAQAAVKPPNRAQKGTGFLT
jgi:hypothetical protein